MNTATVTVLAPSTIDDVRRRLAPLRRARRFPAIAKSCGLSYEWLRLFADGKIANPGVLSLHSLVRAIEEQEALP